MKKYKNSIYFRYFQKNNNIYLIKFSIIAINVRLF